MNDQPSRRLVDQRVRNRIMEAVLTLAEGDEGVRQVWPVEYFEMFYDSIPHHQNGTFPENGAITADERRSLEAVRSIVDAACDATPNEMDADELIATGWPKKIQPVAQRALDLMMSRGRFDEENEEETPSDKSPWPS